MMRRARPPFRFGVYTEGADSAGQWRRQVCEIEAAGFETLLLGDHFDGGLAPLPALSVAAAVTTRLRVGGLVFCNDFRHPALLAKETATLDLLSGGRLDVGIGAGWNAEEYTAAGLTFHTAGVRVTRVEEATAILRGLWTSERFTYRGDHYVLAEASCVPRPVQRPHPPLLIPGGGRRMLALAARYADMVDVTAGFPQIEEVARRVATLERLTAGRSARPERCALLLAVRPGDQEAAAEEVAAELGWSPARVRSSPNVLLGDTEAMVERLREIRHRFGISYVIGPQADLPVLTTVAERLRGK